MKKGVPESKIKIIPVHVDTQFIRPLPKDENLCNLLKIIRKFVVLYAGNIGFSQGLETLLEAASILKDREEIVFVIIAEGVMKSSLENRAKEMQLENCRFLDFQDPENIPKVY
jgi:colanic acid biosynthesis glycosyl transferase WcaI